MLDCWQGIPGMGDPRDAERKGRKRKCKLSTCQSVILGISWGLARTSLPSGMGLFRVELHNLSGRADFTRHHSLTRFLVWSHGESSCHICESRTAGRAAPSGAAAESNGCRATAVRNLKGGCSGQSVESSDPHGMNQCHLEGPLSLVLVR